MKFTKFMTPFSFKLDKQKKTLIIIGAVVLFVAVLFRFFPFFANIESFDDEILLKEKNLIKYRQMVRERNDLEAKLVSLNQTIENAESGLLEGKTPALAAVDVQNILKEITDKSDMEVLTMRVMQPENKEEDIYMIIPVQITVRCSVRQFKETIYQIESASRLLRVSDCRVRVIRGRVEGQVQATLTVQGFMKKYD
jgi:Tfp pilus assembly protein PilO